VKKYGQGGKTDNVYGAGGKPAATTVYGAGGVHSGTRVYSGNVFPSEIPELKLWCRYGSGITITGSGVSQWDDVSGNGNHLKQGTDTNRPSKEADGSILFDGVDNFLKADAFTFIQPEAIYLLAKQVTWVANRYLFDGNTSFTGSIWQNGTSPELKAYAGTNSAVNAGLPVDTYGVMCVVFDGASSLFQIDNNSPITGDFGASNLSGFTLGSRGDGANNSTLQIKELIAFNEAPDTAAIEKVIAYLSNVGGL